jgi:hypothetical protein
MLNMSVLVTFKALCNNTVFVKGFVVI